ncbi:Uncharacterised protein [Mycobacteroides abscessus subsp. abscessus]|nr:Uncharacterised protein [Mycobacteroides abscessus subsp. abscessus]
MPTRSRSSSARFSASALFFLRTLVGASVTFWRIVLCANRLNDWKTIPTSARRVARSRPSSGSNRPSTRISPESMGSSRLIVRHNVDLPEPDGPRTTTTCPAGTSRSMSLRTCSSPKCFCTFLSTIMLVPVAGAGVAGPTAEPPVGESVITVDTNADNPYRRAE